MARTPQLLDQWGRPVERRTLKEEIAAPTFGGVRSPITGYPAEGLNPLRLASILKDADAGNPVRYLELAEQIEERDPHYLGVLGTRKRSVSQIDITVEPGDDSNPDALKHADMVRDWLDRDELTGELFDVLDAIGKGYSFTEIIWDTSEGQWMPKRLEWRDPRWFRFMRHDLRTPLMLDEGGQEVPLPAFKFIFARMKAKSGLPLRSGIARVATWSWMFKAFTQRDWAIFTQTYGQPLRVGKFGAGATEKDKDTLFSAVANIAGDCAAIIPESMSVDFVEAANVGAAHALYKERADWLDQQTSKLVLGQTATTDAVTGGLGSGAEHREVQEDIERADAKEVGAFLTAQLVIPWIQLQFGPQKVYPKIRIARPEVEDLAALSKALAPLIDRGLRVKQSQIMDKFSLTEPEDGDKILTPATKATVPVQAGSPPETAKGRAKSDLAGADGGADDAESAVKHPFNTLKGVSGADPALQAETPPQGRSDGPPPDAVLADRLADEADPLMAALLDRVAAMMQAAGSLLEFREMLLQGFPDLDASALAALMGEAMFAGQAGGIAAVEAEADGDT